ncbi:uncharacterized protein LOC122651916 [Telopea speciosissima]|uniref:uncharacterized protein LOC122651916 n=1 Tax=Telopea speciosissima TaxID=54955 RepID=UPI001CC7846B|nr:uncharacterized protein LOC122651916 [Telopea speciosissima]
MPGIDKEIAEHRLSVYPTAKPVFQKKRTFALERQEKVIEEVTKLLGADFIEEAIYPEWLSNVVMVPKPNGYNQIRMYEPDILKTSFVAGRDTYCYIRMPFGLKNVGASYQRLINYLFRHQIEHNVEVYVDDMLVKSLKAQDHIADLNEAFQVLRESEMRLNPAKCAFGFTSGKFLGFMVSRRGIEANPAKIKAILEMRPLRRVKELQEFTGRIAMLGRFISTSGDRCLPFFRALKNRAKEHETKGAKLAFEWTEECQKAFTELKRYMAQPPLLTKPEPGDTLQLYLAITAIVVSTPLKKILAKPDHSGRLVAWCVELGEFDIHYKPRTAIKAQALADFVVECTPLEEEIPTTTKPEEVVEEWTLYVDGSSSTKGYGIPRTLITDNGKQFEQKFKEFSDQYEILLRKTSVAHPQSNGLAEAMNKILLDGIKKKLETVKGLWVEELPNILWAYRTTTRLVTGETPFILAYGIEAMLPVEIGEISLRVQLYNPEINDEELRINC